MKSKTEVIDKNNINMFNDALFKAWFRSDEARGVVSTFLSAITGISKDKFLNALYIGGELPKRNIKEKGKISDIIVKIDDNNRIIVEMNQCREVNIFEKNSSYAYSILSSKIAINANTYPKIILVNIDNFNKFNTDKPILNFKTRDDEGHIEHELYNSIHLIVENVVKNEYNVDENVKRFCTFLKLTNIDKMKLEYKGEMNTWLELLKLKIC